MPAFCAASASGPTGNPTTPNMNCTPCSLRLFASKSAPLISAMDIPPNSGDRTLNDVADGVKSSQGRPHRLELLRPDGVGISITPFSENYLGVLVEAGLVKGDTLRRHGQIGEFGARQRIAQLRAIAAGSL